MGSHEIGNEKLNVSDEVIELRMKKMDGKDQTREGRRHWQYTRMRRQ